MVEEKSKNEVVCTRCGDCCKGIILYMTFKSDDINDIAKWFNVHKDVSARINGNTVTLYIDNPCEHLSYAYDKNGLEIAKCDIYEQRPDICKSRFNCADSPDFVKHRAEKFKK
jgi:Fe-S-cluster containining protein